MIFPIRYRAAAGILALLVLTVWGAGGDRPARGGVLRAAQRAEPKTFNPVIAMDAPSREVLRRLHADLITIDRYTQKTVPGLAASWSASKDGLHYTLHLRKGVRFSDGAPFTAADVVFSWSVYLDPEVRSPQRDLLMVGSEPIRASSPDAYTVEFTLPKPYAAAERLFDSVAMLPRHKLEAAWKAGKLRDAWTLNTNPAEIAGLGPFRLKQYKPGEAVIVERNPYYWQGDGRPYLDGIEFRLLAGEETQLARFVSGELHVLNRLDMKSIHYLESKGASVTDLGPGLEYNFLCFNLSPGSPRAKWFSQRAFRAALSMAADRESISKLVYQGRATPIWGHVSPGNRLWYAPAAHEPRSIAKARELLKGAGFGWDSGGKLKDAAGDAVEFSILVSTSSSERMRMAAILQADFEALGIHAQVASLEFRSMIDRVMNTRQFDTVLLGLGGGDADPNPEMNVWLSSGAMHLWNPKQKQPATPWEAEVDRLMQAQMVTVRPAERRKIYARIQQIIAAEQPMVFLVSPNVVVAQNGKVGNFRPALLDHFTLWNAQELYLKQGGPAAR